MTIPDSLGWDVVKGLLTAAGALVLWVLNGYVKRQGDHDRRIRELEQWRSVQTTRFHAWQEFGAPERRRP